MTTNYTDTDDGCTERQTDDDSDYSDLLMGTAGEADIVIDVDEETYKRLHEAYTTAVNRGYSKDFRLFLLNHVSRNYTVTVDGEPLPESD